jgi:hypothetical protein
MIDSIRTNEWLQILVFVCLPLVFLLIAVIILLSRGRRKTVAFSGFSVTISSVGREEAYIVYRSNERQLEFAAEIGRGKRFFISRISVRVPKEMPDEDVREVIPNLTLALAKLHYEYFVFRKGELQKISEAEQEAAIAELRQMGCEIKEIIGQGEVQRAVVANWPRFPGEQVKTMMPKVQDLMSKARGVRENIEVLARSDTAR